MEVGSYAHPPCVLGTAVSGVARIACAPWTSAAAVVFAVDGKASTRFVAVDDRPLGTPTCKKSVSVDGAAAGVVATIVVDTDAFGPPS